MKSDSKIYRFFFGKRGERRLPLRVVLLILVPFLLVGLYLQNRKYNALSANPVLHQLWFQMCIVFAIVHI